MTVNNAYSAIARNSVRMARERGAYDYATVHGIFNKAPILHVSFMPADPSEDPFPTTLPMLGTACTFKDPNADPARTQLDIYLHGHAKSRLMKTPKAEGIPVCVSAALLDGIVLALAPFHNSCNYRSAVAHGWAKPVTDEQERMFAMTRITDGLIPNRWDNSRQPPTKGEDRSTGILKVVIETASAKVRVGGPSDDKIDLRDDELTSSVWTGVVPVWEQLGTPQAGAENQCQEVPAYMDDWIQSANEDRENYALEAIDADKS